MLFTEATFLFLFLPATLLLHAMARGSARNVILFLASLLFYMWGEGKFVILMLCSVALNYVFALLIDATRGPRKTRVLWYGVTANLLALLYFKYSNFLIDNVNLVLALARLPIIGTGRIPLPLGISFLTFHTISYLTDVYRGTIRAERKLSDLALYILLFPHLIAGPIVRYADIASQMKKRRLRADELAYGIRRFILGLAKKMLIANQLAVTADQIFGMPLHELDAGLAWLAVLCYTFQIYFDFSGYSDMAIGLAHMFGFTFHENFDHPYSSQSITEFWRRWHISLSSWFRDYVYIPLGGNRRAGPGGFTSISSSCSCSAASGTVRAGTSWSGACTRGCSWSSRGSVWAGCWNDSGDRCGMFTSRSSSWSDGSSSDSRP